MSSHLEPEQFSDVVLGSGNPESEAHLAACAQCQTEIETLRQALTAFRGAAVDWSQGAAERMAFREKPRTHPAFARYAWALAAVVIALAILFQFAPRRGQGLGLDAALAAQAQIARDNQLLAHIDSEIGEITPAPMRPLQVAP